MPNQKGDNQEAKGSLDIFGKKLDVFGVPEDRPIKRTAGEVAELKRKIGLIARVFSKTYDLGVYPSPQGGWCCSIDEKHMEEIERYLHGEVQSLDALPVDALKPKKIYYDVSDVEGKMTDDEVIGVTRHEIGHVNHSDFRLLLEGQRHCMDEGYLATSWASLSNALEDPRVNNLEIAGSDVVREKMSRLYTKWTAETVEKIHTQPATHQLGLALIYYWLSGEFIKNITDKKVIDTFNEIKPHADRYMASDSAQEAHEILKNDIWPLYKKLEQKAVADEKLKELMRRISGSSLGDARGEGGRQGAQQDAISKIVSEIKKALGVGNDKSSDRIGQGADGGLKKRVGEEMRAQEEAAANRNAKLQSKKKATGSMPDDISLDDVADDLKKDLQDMIARLPSDQKKELEDAAREQVDAKQAAQVNKRNPKSVQMEKDDQTGQYLPKIQKADEAKAQKIEQQVDAYNEIHKREEAARQEALSKEQAAAEAAAEQARRQLAEIAEAKKEGFDSNDIELYRQFKQLEREMEGYIASFMKLLDRYLPKKEESIHQGAYYVGKKINKKEIVKRAVFRDNRFFSRRESIESSEPRMFVTLLIDRTGSMHGQKMRESLKTAIFLARVLERFGIPFAIKFFGSSVESIMRFGQDYDDPVNRIKPNLLKKGIANDRQTDIAAPMKETVGDMTSARRQYAGCHGGIFVISDSGANAGEMVGDALGAYISDQQKRYTIVNLLLSGNEDDLKEAQKLFGERHVVQASDFTDLPKAAFNVLRILLERVLKTYRQSQ